MENFDFKKYLSESKLLKEVITPDVEEYLMGLYDLSASEEHEEGEEIINILSREEYGDSEAYDDADMFDKSYNEIKKQGGSVTIEGQPNITFSLEGEDIKMVYTVEY
jgi:subtilase family serine protease